MMRIEASLIAGGNTAETVPPGDGSFAKALGAATHKDKDAPTKDPTSDDMWQALVSVLTRAEMVAAAPVPTAVPVGPACEPIAVRPGDDAPASDAPPAAVPVATAVPVEPACEPIAVRPGQDETPAVPAAGDPQTQTKTAVAPPVEPTPIGVDGVPTPAPRIKTLRTAVPPPQDGPGVPAPEPTQVRFSLPEPAAPNVVVVPTSGAPPPPPAPVPAPAAAAPPVVTAPVLPLEVPPERGHIGATRAEVIIGEGNDQLALRITAAGNQVRVEATAASTGLAQALSRDAGELRAALSRHGLELSELAQTQEDNQPNDVKRVARKNWTVA